MELLVVQERIIHTNQDLHFGHTPLYSFSLTTSEQLMSNKLLQDFEIMSMKDL